MWADVIGGCVPNWVDNANYAIYFTALAVIPFTIISITSIWTFVFTRAFISRHLQRQKDVLNTKELKAQKSIYSEKMRNLVGIFGALLICNMISWSPYFVTSIISLIVGSENLPATLYASVSILYLFTNVTNPIIQIYFRKDLLDKLKTIVGCKCVKSSRPNSCPKGRIQPPSSSTHETEASIGTPYVLRDGTETPSHTPAALRPHDLGLSNGAQNLAATVLSLDQASVSSSDKEVDTDSAGGDIHAVA